MTGARAPVAAVRRRNLEILFVFILEIFGQAFDLLYNTVVTIPLENALATVYTVANLLLQLLFLGSEPGTGGIPLPF